MSTATLQMVFSKSVATDNDLVSLKQRIFREFEDDLSSIFPQGLLVITDGSVFLLNEESDYDNFVRKLDEYFMRRKAQRKIVTISVYLK